MKARVKATGEIINIADYARVRLDRCDSYGNPIELSFDEVEILQERSDNIDWEKRRYELAKDYSTEFVKLQHKKGITECGILYPDVVSWSVELADALIKKLKGE